jgi:hypothetical protein
MKRKPAATSLAIRLLRSENARLKRLVEELRIDRDILQNVARFYSQSKAQPEPPHKR